MATNIYPFSPKIRPSIFYIHHSSFRSPTPTPDFYCRRTDSFSFSSHRYILRSFSSTAGRVLRRRSVLMASLLPENRIAHDVCVAGLASGVAVLLLRFWEEMAKAGVFEQAVVLAALAPCINIIRMLLLGLGIVRSDAMVKSISRHGDYRELLKGPLYYACTITMATVFLWRTSPIAITTICNLCAGDGFADVIGRRFGRQTLPYNKNKSFVGSIAMASAGFIASVGFMYYFSLFGFVERSWGLVSSFLVVSVAAAVVESLPISTELDDNLSVPLTSLFVGSIVL
ncbi:putative phytol kinase 2, chloroplastic isoform X2 [Tasmannia lanceolata]|uniref:putative phytol kinase 2, chloroplastic isoform X2 n=1 Tax=Tasmannia lanceolata TaxID=3420 RepID=UPI004064B1C8